MEDQNNIDDMDSLFEGMVLFTPQVVDNNESDSHLDVHSVKYGDKVALSSVSSLSSQPLDENLFSDLTVIAPTDVEASEMQLSPEPSVSMTSSVMKTEREATIVARQSSRKKKRAGLRVGYGRDSQVVDSEPLSNPPELSSFVESSLSDTTLAIPTDTHGVEEEEQGVLPSVASQSKHSGSSPTQHKNEHGVHRLMDVVESDSNQVHGDEHMNLTKDTNITSATAEVNDLGTFPEQAKEEEDSSSDSVNAKYELIKAQINEKLRRAKDQASLISVAKKDCRRRRKAAEDVELASVSYREIEKKLEDACEAEDFEMAE